MSIALACHQSGEDAERDDDEDQRGRRRPCALARRAEPDQGAARRAGPAWRRCTRSPSQRKPAGRPAASRRRRPRRRAADSRVERRSAARDEQDDADGEAARSTAYVPTAGTRASADSSAAAARRRRGRFGHVPPSARRAICERGEQQDGDEQQAQDPDVDRGAPAASRSSRRRTRRPRSGRRRTDRSRRAAGTRSRMPTAVTPIMRLLVAVATRSGTPMTRCITGTFTMPPPTPRSADTTPAPRLPAMPRPGTPPVPRAGIGARSCRRHPPVAGRRRDRRVGPRRVGVGRRRSRAGAAS